MADAFYALAYGLVRYGSPDLLDPVGILLLGLLRFIFRACPLAVREAFELSGALADAGLYLLHPVPNGLHVLGREQRLASGPDHTA